MAIIGWNPTTEDEVVVGLLRIYGEKVTDENVAKCRERMRAVETMVSFEGKAYLVPNIAYYINKPIELPDGRQIRVLGWMESLPPSGGGQLIDDQLFPFTDVYKAVEE